MKAIGAKNSDILSIFLIESGLLGIVGGVLGIFLGYLRVRGVAAIQATAVNPMIKAKTKKPVHELSLVPRVM